MPREVLMSASEFVHLHVHSQYSLLDGVSHFGPLFENVKKLGMDTIALTDHGNLFGAVAFYQEAQDQGIKPIIGCEVYVAPSDHRDKTSGDSKKYHHMVLLSENYEGYLNLCWLVSKGYLDGFYYKPRIDKELLASHSKGLIGLSGCMSGVVAQHFRDGHPERAEAMADDLREILGRENFYLEIMDHGLPEQKMVNQNLIDLSKRMDIPLVATNDAHYIKSDDANTQDLLMAIGTGKTFSDENRISMDAKELYLKSPQEMVELFGHLPGAIENTVAIARRCHSEIRFGSKELLPEYDCPDGKSTEEYMREVVEAGLRERYGEITDDVRERYEHEMHIIKSMGFLSYFLVVWDFVNYARREKIPTGCRGSGAGSIVAYAMGITELDPIQYKLFFERFLNPERVSMPDFDIDLCAVRRSEVIDYVRRKYGADNVANIITFGTMKAKAAVRDIGRVKGLDLAFVDRVAKLIPEGPKVTMKSALADSQDLHDLYENDPQVTELIDEAKRIEGTVRQPGMHAAGVVVCSKPLIEAIPLYKPAGKEEVITQYNMVEVEQLGLLKIDFLGLKNLTIIADCIALIKENHGVEIDWKEIGFDDPATYDVLQRGDGFGIFQVESEGMRGMLKKAKPENLEDVTALIALYRPGPLQFMDNFINRKHGREKVHYHHPLMEEPLKETFGLMIYQEQVMQVSNVIAGFSLGKADELRRAMSKKKDKIIAKMRIDFIKGAAEKNIDEKLADTIYAEIAKFANYGFNKAHAASYAVLTYRTAYLKAHYPVEYMAAVLTSEIRGGASDKLGMYIGVAREMGLNVLQPDINESQNFFSVVDGDIRFGLAAIKNVGHGPVGYILEERDKNGPFESFQDFCSRVDQTHINSRAIECLIMAGAFDKMEGTRPQLLAIMNDALEMGASQKKLKESGQTSLFDMLGDSEDTQDFNTISLPRIPDWTDREKLNKEKELAGIFLSGHPLDRFAPDIKSFASHTSADLLELQGEQADMALVGMVMSVSRITTKTKQEPMAFVTLEDLSGKFEAVFFPRTYEQYQHLLTVDAMLYLRGKGSKKQDRDSANLLVDECFALEDVRRKRAKFVDIFMPAEPLDIKQLENLRSLFRQNRGNIPVRLHFTWNGTAEMLVEPHQRFRINPSDAFLKDFDKLDFKKRLRFGEN
ncbi:MAG: DNA polymerase III subunit alpha [bacterium]